MGLTGSLRLADAPGNVLLRRRGTGLKQDSVVNVTQLFALDKEMLTDRIGRIGADLMRSVDDGLRLSLTLD